MTGSIGLLGTRPSYEMMMNCDTLLTVGSSFPYTQFLPKFDQARGVQIDIDGKLIGMRYPNEVNLVGDAAATLRALIPHLKRQDDRSWRGGIEAGVARWWQSMDAEAEVEANPVNPMLLFRELSTRLPVNAIVAADSGSSANWYARQLKFRGDMRGSLSGTLATMGPGVPYGIGAKFAHPERPVIVFAGDGAMQMNGLAELITIKHYWEQWSDPRLIVAVLHNNDLNQVTWEMRAMEGAPKFVESQQLPDVDYAGFAQPGPERDRRRRPGPARRGLGPGADRHPSHRPGRAHRPVHPAHPAARHLPAGQGRRHRAAQGRPRRLERAQGRHPHQGPGNPPRPARLRNGGLDMTRYGYFLSAEEPSPAELVRQARMAEEAGFDALWISDHYHPWLDEQGEGSFVWSVIGAISAVTSLPVTTAVTCPLLRTHPAIIAPAAATSSLLSGGRFTLGVGSGEALNEHILGTAWPSAEERLEMLEEAVEVIRELLSGRLITHHGPHYRVDTARLYSVPGSPPPVFMSGFGEKAIKLAARPSDGYICVQPNANFVRLYRDSGGGDRPVQGGLKVCWDTDAGFDEVYVTQVGSGHAGFFEFYASQVLPRLREA